MKKWILLVLCFFVSFIGTIYFTLPYKFLYQYALDNLHRGNLNINYCINTAHLFSLKIKDISLKIKDKTIKFDSLYMKWNPILYLFKKRFLFLSLTIPGCNKKIIIYLKRKDDNFIVIGKIPDSIAKVLSEDYPVLKFLKSLKNNVHILIKFNYENNQIIFKKIQLIGDFELKATGYIKNGFIVLNGMFRYQKYKTTFSYSKRIWLFGEALDMRGNSS